MLAFVLAFITAVIVGLVIDGIKRSNEIKRKQKIKKVEQKRQNEYALQKEKEWQKVKEDIRSIVEPHLITLSKKQKQLIVFDDYGNYKEDGIAAFNKEIYYFMKSVLNIEQDYENNEQIDNYFQMVDFIISLVHEYDLAQIQQDNDLEFDTEMTPIEYEHYCKDIIENQGYKTYATKGSGDQGVDVIVNLEDGNKIAIQCKKYNQPVGNKAVQEVYAAAKHIGANMSMVVSNQGYTKSANELSSTTGVLLLHHDELKNMANFL